MRRSLMTVFVLGAVLVPFRTARAQAIGPVGLRVSATELAAVARLQPERHATVVQPALVARDDYQHGTRREGVALMVVGLAGIATGLIIDEPFVTVIGAGVGGLGLYFYLR